MAEFDNLFQFTNDISVFESITKPTTQISTVVSSETLGHSEFLTTGKEDRIQLCNSEQECNMKDSFSSEINKNFSDSEMPLGDTVQAFQTNNFSEAICNPNEHDIMDDILSFISEEVSSTNDQRKSLHNEPQSNSLDSSSQIQTMAHILDQEHQREQNSVQNIQLWNDSMNEITKTTSDFEDQSMNEITKVTTDFVNNSMNEITKVAPDFVNNSMNEITKVIPDFVNNSMNEITKDASDFLHDGINDITKATSDLVGQSMNEITEATPDFTSKATSDQELSELLQSIEHNITSNGSEVPSSQDIVEPNQKTNFDRITNTTSVFLPEQMTQVTINTGNAEPQSSAFEELFYIDNMEQQNMNQALVKSHFNESNDITAQKNNSTTKCPVCIDGNAGKHNHYGGRVCHSCRGFFRRSVQNNHFPMFECDRGLDDCVIESKTRKSCKFCRFQKCLDKAGLKVEQVLSYEERLKRVVARTNRFQGTVKQSSKYPIMIPMIPVGIYKGLSKDEILVLQKKFITLLDFNHSKTFELFHRYPIYMDSFLNSVKLGNPFTKEFLMEMDSLDRIATINFCFSLPELSRLSHYDRMKLISSNAVLIQAMMWAWWMSRKDFTSE